MNILKECKIDKNSWYLILANDERISSSDRFYSKSEFNELGGSIDYRFRQKLLIGSIIMKIYDCMKDLNVNALSQYDYVVLTDFINDLFDKEPFCYGNGVRYFEKDLDEEFMKYKIKSLINSSKFFKIVDVYNDGKAVARDIARKTDVDIPVIQLSDCFKVALSDCNLRFEYDCVSYDIKYFDAYKLVKCPEALSYLLAYVLFVQFKDLRNNYELISKGCNLLEKTLGDNCKIPNFSSIRDYYNSLLKENYDFYSKRRNNVTNQGVMTSRYFN